MHMPESDAYANERLGLMGATVGISEELSGEQELGQLLINLGFV
jgi:hypothetical protein